MTQLSIFPKNEHISENWKAALCELRNLGYSIRVEGDNIRLIYHGKDEPQTIRVASLINTLKVHKMEILNDPYFLITETIDRISEVWEPSTLVWMKQARPVEWVEMLFLEKKIDQYTLQADSNSLKKALREYLTLMVSVARDFHLVAKRGNSYGR